MPRLAGLAAVLIVASFFVGHLWPLPGEEALEGSGGIRLVMSAIHTQVAVGGTLAWAGAMSALVAMGLILRPLRPRSSTVARAKWPEGPFVLLSLAALVLDILSVVVFFGTIGSVPGGTSPAELSDFRSRLVAGTKSLLLLSVMASATAALALMFYGKRIETALERAAARFAASAPPPAFGPVDGVGRARRPIRPKGPRPPPGGF